MTDDPTSWATDANCTDTPLHWWFPETNGRNRTTRQALNLCRTCTVATDCLRWAVFNNETGIWGGTNDKQRRDIRRRYGIKAQQPNAIHSSHGTEAGARAHYRRGEPVCPDCAHASRQATRQRRQLT